MTQDELDLLHSYLHDTLSEPDFARLQMLLRENAEARRTLRALSTVNAKLQQIAAVNPATLQLLAAPAVPETRRGFRWLSWRPLTAAAAGLVIGLFSASAVWAYAMGQRRVTLLHEGFEGGPTIAAQRHPSMAGQWAAEASAVVGAEVDVVPKEGRRMLQMGPHPRDKSARAFYALDLRGAMPLASGARNLLEVQVSFHAALPGLKSRYILRAAAFAEELEKVDPLLMFPRWSEVQEDALAYAARGMTAGRGPAEWQTLSLTLDVPSGARVLFLTFWAQPEEEWAGGRTAYYADDVRVSVLPREPLP